MDVTYNMLCSSSGCLWVRELEAQSLSCHSYHGRVSARWSRPEVPRLSCILRVMVKLLRKIFWGNCNINTNSKSFYGLLSGPLSTTLPHYVSLFYLFIPQFPTRHREVTSRQDPNLSVEMGLLSSLLLSAPQSHAIFSYESGQSSSVITLSHYPVEDVTYCQKQPRSHQTSIPTPNLMGLSV